MEITFKTGCIMYVACLEFRGEKLSRMAEKSRNS